MDWNHLPPVPADIAHGDMPGDKVNVGEEHVRKAALVYPKLRQAMEEQPGRRAVIGVFGGSGVGKSEIASVLAYWLNEEGLGAYIMSGDNYPRRIPRENDLERLRVYREGGTRALAEHDLLSREAAASLQACWAAERDADPALGDGAFWAQVYAKAGRRALTGYLGTLDEINFDEVSGILSRFHQGMPAIWFKRMGREMTELWYDKVDLSSTRALILEWTHAGSDYLEGVDFPVFLHSTPAETLAHRRARNRDGKLDSAFTTLVLDIEQKKLNSQAGRAAFILSKQGQLMSPADFQQGV